MTILRKYNSLLKKYRLEKEHLLRKMLLEDFRMPRGAFLVPNLRLAYLFHKAKITLKAKDYRNALTYAHSQKLFGLFCRLALFFPEPVVHIMQKGKNPSLPTAFLEMPVFQVEPPVYNVNLLGRLQVFKGEQLLPKLRLSPKDTSFLIRLSLSKTRKISCNELYQNYWPRSQKPPRNLSHLLVRIKKSLGLSARLLKIRHGYLLWNFYLNTDYQYFAELIAQAKALERIGEWQFAKREYLKAFALFRTEPFRKIYDNWSLNMRHVILRKLEEEVKGFAKTCLDHNDKQEVQKILTRFRKRGLTSSIIWDSNHISDSSFESR